MLERSYHVATQDYDKDFINESALAFAAAAKSALGAKVRFSLDKFSMESDVMCMRLPR